MRLKASKIRAFLPLVFVHALAAISLSQEATLKELEQPSQPATAQEGNAAANTPKDDGSTPSDAVKPGSNQTLVDKALVASIADCDLHVIGIYMPKDSSKDDRVYVEVKKTERPMVVTLSAYGSTQWNLKVEPDAPLKLIVVAGYFEQELANPPPNVPVVYRTYFAAQDREKMKHLTSAEKEAREYFWASSWHTKEGRDLKRKLKDLTGLDVKTFQSTYEGSTFVIDGIRGDLKSTETTESLPGTPGLPRGAGRVAKPPQVRRFQAFPANAASGASAELYAQQELIQKRILEVQSELIAKQQSIDNAQRILENIDNVQRKLKLEQQVERLEQFKEMKRKSFENISGDATEGLQPTSTEPESGGATEASEASYASVSAIQALRKQLDESVQTLEQDYRDAEQAVIEAARDFHREATDKRPDVEFKQKRTQLRKLVAHSFTAQRLLQDRRMHLASIDLQLLLVKQEHRRTHADKIIERRVNDLISGQDLSWPNSAIQNRKVTPEPTDQKLSNGQPE